MFIETLFKAVVERNDAQVVRMALSLKNVNIRKECSMIKQLKGAYEIIQIEMMVAALITNLNNYFNVKRFLTAGQISEMAILIVSEDDWLCVEDLAQIFNSMKVRGDNLYNAIDGAIIFREIQTRWEQIDNNFLNEHYKRKWGTGEDGGSFLNSLTTTAKYMGGTAPTQEQTRERVREQMAADQLAGNYSGKLEDSERYVQTVEKSAPKKLTGHSEAPDENYFNGKDGNSSKFKQTLEKIKEGAEKEIKKQKESNKK